MIMKFGTPSKFFFITRVERNNTKEVKHDKQNDKDAKEKDRHQSGQNSKFLNLMKMR